MTSGRLYSLVTKHWPRVAAGLVVVIGLAEFVVGGLTADSGIEFYLMAWAGTTGGLWFLFEKAEKTLSEESRAKVLGWIEAASLRDSIESLPDHFAALFDRVFGRRHLTWQTFRRSAVASLASVAIIGLAYMAADSGMMSLEIWITLGFWALATNVVPDYLSLLETRYLLRKLGGAHRTVKVLLVDALATGGIAAVSVAVSVRYLVTSPMQGWQLGECLWFDWETLRRMVTLENYACFRLEDGLPVRGGPPFPVGLFFYSTFFTSVWLWLYAASVLASRALLRMNDGVGFLLRVTDVENQPFRSMGFVSVIIVSGLFALGLPFVLL